MDLNIDNYNLEDLLHLFKLPLNFEEGDLKVAKQKVLKTHPDKSGLPTEYFLFYSKAYKIVYSLFVFKNKSNKQTTYSVGNESVEDDYESKERLLTRFFEQNKVFKEDPTKFNKWFNAQFDQCKLSLEDADGYGDWLKTDDDLYTAETGTMKEQMDKHKRHTKSMIVYNGIMDASLPFSGEILGEPNGGNFSSSMFSNLSFQDIKQAHTESVIPITDDDYVAVRKFESVDEYKRHRETTLSSARTENTTTHNDLLHQSIKMEDEISTQRAYYYAKQQVEIGHKNALFWSKLQKIT